MLDFAESERSAGKRAVSRQFCNAKVNESRCIIKKLNVWECEVAATRRGQVMRHQAMMKPC